MGHLHGPVVGGVVQVEQRVKFKKQVQSGLWYPWQNVWYVDGDNGNDGYSGRGPADSKLTIQGAIDAAAAQDVVYVRTKETDGDASDIGFYKPEQMIIPFAKHNLSVIGVHHGSDHLHGPFMWFDDAGYALDVYASAFHLENMTIHAEGATGAINLRGLSGYTASAGACGSTIEHCCIGYGKSVITGGGNSVFFDVQFRNCCPSLYYDASATPARKHRVLGGCEFWANNGAAIATAYVRILGSQSEFFLRDSYFDQPTGQDEYIYSTGVVDGLIANCFFSDDEITWGADAGDEIRIVSGTLSVAGCYDNTGLIIEGT